MTYYSYRVSDGLFLRGWPNPPPFDLATEALQEYPEHLRPNQRTERFDANTSEKKRPATAQEIADYDAAQQTAHEKARFDDEKMLKALAIWTAQKIGVPLATAKAEILTIYRGLP